MLENILVVESIMPIDPKINFFFIVAHNFLLPIFGRFLSLDWATENFQLLIVATKNWSPIFLFQLPHHL
jgi:hypothetical protein